MIHITIDLWPYGDRDRAKTIGEMDIWNDASGDRRIGNYRFRWFRRSRDESNRKCKEHTGFVEGFHRQSKHVFDLLRLALNANEEPICCECGRPLERFDRKCHHTHILPEVKTGDGRGT
jgi:hypothetical protein